MGWLFQPGITRKELVRQRTKDWSLTNEQDLEVTTTCLAHCYRGNLYSGVLWAVWERTFLKDGREAQAEERWITCDLLRCHSGDWGYKDMSEQCGPFYYSCPLGYLKMVPLEEYDGNKEWREKVQNYHQNRKEKRQLKTPAKSV